MNRNDEMYNNKRCFVIDTFLEQIVGSIGR